MYKVGSFPSGHAAVGWAWSLVLIKLFPEKEKEILKRGHDFGESLIVLMYIGIVMLKWEELWVRRLLNVFGVIRILWLTGIVLKKKYRRF